MKINGTIFSKPQQDQLKRGIGTELGKVVAKVNDVDRRMLNYMGDWVTGNEYKENDVVTWRTDGHLYEVIKAHTSSATFDPDNPEYYKAMTSKKWIRQDLPGPVASARSVLLNTYAKDQNAIIECVDLTNGVEILCRFSSTTCISGATFNSDDDYAELVTIDFTTGKVLYQHITATNTTTLTNADALQITAIAWEQ